MALKDTPIHNDKKIGRCKFRKIWDGLDADDKATLTGWVEAGWGYRTIRSGLVQDGHVIGDLAVDRHIKGICHCDYEEMDDDPVYRCRAPKETGTPALPASK